MFVHRLILNKISFVAKNNLLLQNKENFLRLPIIRNAHTGYFYRKTPTLEFKKDKLFVFIGSTMWWWFFWNLFTEYHMLLGYHYPDASEWTNEELGIPED